MSKPSQKHLGGRNLILFFPCMSSLSVLHIFEIVVLILIIIIIIIFIVCVSACESHSNGKDGEAHTIQEVGNLHLQIGQSGPDQYFTSSRLLAVGFSYYGNGKSQVQEVQQLTEDCTAQKWKQDRWGHGPELWKVYNAQCSQGHPQVPQN